MKKFVVVILSVGVSVSILFTTLYLTSITPKKTTILKVENKLSKELNIYNWEDYFGEDTITGFEKRFGVKVNLDTFLDEEESIASLMSHPEKYDIFVTSGDGMRELIEKKILSEIDFDNIPNMKNIDPKFINRHYDPKQEYTVPYLWGTTGVAINRKFVKEDVDSWSILWNSKYKGKIAMLPSPDETMAAAAKMLGYSINTRSPFELEDIRQSLLTQVSLITGYKPCIETRDNLISNKLWVAHIYSGEAMFASDKNENIEYIIPKEGSPVWIDCFAIPRDAHHKYTAEVFINYVLEAKVTAEISNYLWYANCNLAANEYTDEEILESPSIYPSKEILDKCEFFKPVASESAERLYSQKMYKTWSELRLELKNRN